MQGILCAYLLSEGVTAGLKCLFNCDSRTDDGSTRLLGYAFEALECRAHCEEVVNQQNSFAGLNIFFGDYNLLGGLFVNE